MRTSKLLTMGDQGMLIRIPVAFWEFFRNVDAFRTVGVELKRQA